MSRLNRSLRLSIRAGALQWDPFGLPAAPGTPTGDFLELPELDLDRLEAAWQEAVFALYLAEDKIEPEVLTHRRKAKLPVNRIGPLRA